MDRAKLTEAVERGLTQMQIASEFGIGQTATRYWLNKFGLETKRPVRLGCTNCIFKVCGREFVYGRRAGHRLEMCNSCGVNIRRFALKEKCVQYKGGKCSKCGYDRCIIALEFHHINPNAKEFTIAGRHCIKWSRIKEELDKCILLCANYHREEEFIVASANGRPAVLYPASSRSGRSEGSIPSATTKFAVVTEWYTGRS
jgi:hypothetical protein